MTIEKKRMDERESSYTKRSFQRSEENPPALYSNVMLPEPGSKVD
jgi:hypothetical protein